MISMLVPLRLENLDTFLTRREVTLKNAHCPERVQWVIYLDHDEARAALGRIPDNPNDIIVIGPRFGYYKLHRYFNKLAAVAGGDWLMLFGDDCTIVTEGWDTAIMQCGHPEEAKYLIGTNDAGGNPCFPIISRAAYEIMGCFSKHWANDTWLAELFAAVWPEQRQTINMHVLNENVRQVKLDPGFWTTLRKFIDGLAAQFAEETPHEEV